MPVYLFEELQPRFGEQPFGEASTDPKFDLCRNPAIRVEDGVTLPAAWREHFKQGSYQFYLGPTVHPLPVKP